MVLFMKNFFSFVSRISSICLLFAVNVGAALDAYAEAQSTVQESVQFEKNLTDEVCPAVVRIMVKKGSRYVSGTGFFMGEKGAVVTNNHVVEDADWIGVMVVSKEGKSARVYTAYPIRDDKKRDLALIRVDAEVLPEPLKLASKQVNVLDDVIAVGFPGALDKSISKKLGFESGVTYNPEIIENLTPNVTKGAVSKISEGRITHDAKISTGNSGGPLIDVKTREVIGVNTMGIVDSLSAFYIAVSIDGVRDLLARTDVLIKADAVTDYKVKADQEKPRQFKDAQEQIDLKSVISAADAGDCKAQLLLGKMYLLGEDVEYNADKGLEYITKSAEQGNADAYFSLGDVYESGICVKADVKKALEYYERASELGSVDARFRAALIYFEERKNPSMAIKAFALFKAMAADGDSRSYYWLATCYAEGIGTSKSRDEAKAYFLKSYEEFGDEEKFPYGMFLLEDKATHQEGVRLILECADAGESLALWIVAHWYLEGENVEENMIKAIDCFTKAAKLGEAMAIHELGGFYYNGQGVQKNLEVAEKLLQESAAAGITASWYMLSGVYDEKEQPGLAVHCLQKGASLGNGLCALNLGLRYHFAKGVRPSREQEIKWLRVAATQEENRDAQIQAKKLLRTLGVSVSSSKKSSNSNPPKKSKTSTTPSSGNKSTRPKEAPKPRAAAQKW